MVLEYIVTVWDSAEPKTYNSKVSKMVIPKRIDSNRLVVELTSTLIKFLNR